MYCLCCGKELTKNTGKFCNKSCAAKYNNLRRTHTKETKEKISDTLTKRNDNLRQQGIAKVGNPRICIVCGKEFMPKRLKNYRFSKKQTCSPECTRVIKIQRSTESMQKIMQEGRHKGWLTRNIISYAERFWMNVLENNSISYIKEYYFEGYFLDFYIEKNNLKIDLEIDGKQHEFEERKEHDKIRDHFLKNNNFIVYRIKWNDIKDENGKNMMQDKINDFLNWYNKLGVV